ncbi:MULTISPECIES: sorbosone dehydrogenase family protein [unclassified Halomonas]|uniref:PQQ-dependent sugar dehydrogenase n=1 Tax=unclassified Halomonas TaxID=2609666 RepID=UPI001EF61E53|nr:MULTISPECIES: sorbosone dehydrogenase family protein [unclassified Halomonas]MCG7577119.1 sorbosone dehydrogenase family protein [Halomonas sp. MMH1-48]MCG7604069.1 sorbosone dehydrogenase family protein [Halomonas sp. MM17-34]MCG7613319.1 sorbosone dehydrogenase family protein [Halomonas sp. MM17-29]MCG7620207.1 sorbosone dehydrogenase family protein [Halomonas sp. DSH1-27]
MKRALRRPHCYAAPLCLMLAAGSVSAQEFTRYGPNPTLPEPSRGLLPSMSVPEPAEWGDTLPNVPEGYTITAIATDLQIPRQTLVLPNGDILVAEGSGGNAPSLKPKDFVAGLIKSQGTTSVQSGNRLTLLHDGDGDGRYEEQTTFAEDLNAPYGLALIDDTLYVANQDALVRFDYEEGQTQAIGPPEVVTLLPAEINHHWTKAMTASADGEFLYVGIGSNSNITERGMEAEVNRAEIWQIDPDTGMHRPYATGLRNPTAMAIQPDTDQLWTVVNERDELGPDLVPDYLTTVQEGGFYGWPYSYWGQHVDPRVQPRNPEKVESAIAPDYALGSHVAPLGLAFSNASMGDEFANGVFIGEHGSWNRADPVGYKVVFVPFSNGQPSGDPVDFVSGFLTDDGSTRGRPVGVTVDPDGALIIADDLTNAIWRVTPDDASMRRE